MLKYYYFLKIYIFYEKDNKENPFATNMMIKHSRGLELEYNHERII